MVFRKGDETQKAGMFPNECMKHAHTNRYLRHSSKTRLILVDDTYYIFHRLLPVLFRQQEPPVGAAGASKGLGIGGGSVYCNEVPDTSPNRWAK